MTDANAAAAAGPQRFDTAQTAAVVALSILVGCVPSLQPILLGALHDAGRIDAGQIGLVATVEAAGMFVGSAVAAAFFRPTKLRALAVVTMIVVALANALTLAPSTALIFAGRGLSGLGSGITLWLLVGLMTRAANPGRLFAIYVTCQGILAFALSTAMTQWIVPMSGPTGGYVALIALSVVMAGVGLLVPPAYQSTGASHRAALPAAHGMLGLLAVAAYLAGILAFWVYLPSLAADRGYDPQAVARAVGIGTIGQIAGGLAAIGLAGRVNSQRAVLAATLASIGVVLVLEWTNTLPLLYGVVIAFNLLWMFTPPFQLPMLMAMDPSNRSAMFISPAQLAGLTIGPSVAAMSLSVGPQGPAYAGIGLFGLSILLIALVAVLPKPKAPLAG